MLFIGSPENSHIIYLEPKSKSEVSQVPVAHIYNPSNSGDRDQEDHCSKPAQAIVPKTLSQKNPSQKWTGRVAQGVCRP
jgi:hypothetical protein